MVNQHRDSYASYIGHHSLISYFAVAQNESIARVKFEFVEVSIMPTIKIFFFLHIIYII